MALAPTFLLCCSSNKNDHFILSCLLRRTGRVVSTGSILSTGLVVSCAPSVHAMSTLYWYFEYDNLSFSPTVSPPRLLLLPSKSVVGIETSVAEATGTFSTWEVSNNDSEIRCTLFASRVVDKENGEGGNKTTGI